MSSFLAAKSRLRWLVGVAVPRSHLIRASGREVLWERIHREPVVLSLVILGRFEASAVGVICFEGGWLLFPASAVRHGVVYNDYPGEVLERLETSLVVVMISSCRYF
jgi:hypothetical protein